MLPTNVSSRFVVPQRNRFGVPQVIVARPFEELDLRDQHRLQPPTVLHLRDCLGQQMTALRRNLEAVRMREEPDPSRIAQVARTEQLAEELDRSIDFLTWELRPAALHHLGLAAALRNLVRGWSERFTIAAEFQPVDTELRRLPPDTETCPLPWMGADEAARRGAS